MEAHSTVVYPLIEPPLGLHVDGEEVLQEVVGLDGVVACEGVSDVTLPVSIEVVSSLEKNEELARVWKWLSIDASHFVRFETREDVDLPALESQLLEHNRHLEAPVTNVEGIAGHILATNLLMAADTLLLATTLAHPGSVRTAPAFPETNGEPIGRGSYSFGTWWAEVLWDEDGKSWPPIVPLAVSKTWEWVSRIPTQNGVPVGPVGRAYASFSHLSEAQRTAPPLIWALIGLEALYGRGVAGMKDQLVQKSYALLGAPSMKQRALDKAYNLRSRMLHGDLDFPLAFDPGDHDFHGELHEAGKWVSSILLASLQQLAQADAHGLEFAISVQLS